MLPRRHSRTDPHRCANSTSANLIETRARALKRAGSTTATGTSAGHTGQPTPVTVGIPTRQFGPTEPSGARARGTPVPHPAQSTLRRPSERRTPTLAALRLVACGEARSSRCWHWCGARPRTPPRRPWRGPASSRCRRRRRAAGCASRCGATGTIRATSADGIPRSAQRPVRMFPYVGFDNYAAAVPASVTSAETESRSGKRARHRTFAARGFAERFVLIPAPPSAVFVRFYGADGTLLGIDGGPAGYIDITANKTPVFGVHDEGVEAHTELRLAPTPDQADRLRTLACIDVFNRTRGGCGLDLESDNALLAAGLVRPARSRRRGRRRGRRKRSADAGERRGAHASRAGAARGLRRPPRDRRAGPERRGRTRRDGARRRGPRRRPRPGGTEPGGQPCAERDTTGEGFGGALEPTSPPAGAVAVASAGGVSLLVADQGETLCVGLGALEDGHVPAAAVRLGPPGAAPAGRDGRRRAEPRRGAGHAPSSTAARP